MKTKYDIGQVVTLKMKAMSINIGFDGAIEYEISKVSSGGDYWEGSITYKEEELNESNISV